MKIIVPYHRGSTLQRAAVLQRVTDHLHDEGFETHLCDSEPWSPGAARNNGVAACSEDSSMVVFNDADTLVPGEQIRRACYLAAETGSLVYSYDLYIRRTRNGAVDRELFMPPSMGSVAIPLDTFLRLGGFDENYVGWGYEDVDFAERAAKLVGVRRISGVAEHLWHGERRRDDSPDDSDPELVGMNLERFRLSAGSTYDNRSGHFRR